MASKTIDIWTDRDLIAGLKRHDKHLFTVIYNQYAEGLFYHALKFVKSADLAEDIVQDVFIKLWQQGEKLEIEQSLKAYLYRAVQNHMLNKIKRGQLHGQALAALALDDATKNHTEENLYLKETALNAQRAINRLPPQCKLIFELSRNQDMTHRQIAEQLNIADSTVNNQLVKAIRIIKTYLNVRNSFGAIAALLAISHNF